MLPDSLHTAHYVRARSPVDVTGIEPAKGLCLQGLGLSTFDTHPTILFWLGNRRPSGGRTDALCWPGASGSRGARPGRHLTRALPPTPSAPRAVPTASTGTADELRKQVPNSSATTATRATSAALASHAFGDDSHHLPAPSRGKKERKLF